MDIFCLKCHEHFLTLEKEFFRVEACNHLLCEDCIKYRRTCVCGKPLGEKRYITLDVLRQYEKRVEELSRNMIHVVSELFMEKIALIPIKCLIYFDICFTIRAGGKVNFATPQQICEIVWKHTDAI